MLKIRIAIPFAGLALTACGQSETGRPNVIYVFPDQYRNSSLGFWSDPEFAAEVGWKGDPVATPNLDRFAREATVLTERRGAELHVGASRKFAARGRRVYRRRLLGGGLRLRLHRQAARRLPDEEQPPASGNLRQRRRSRVGRLHAARYSYGTYDVHKHPHYWDTDGNRHDVDEWSPRHEVSKAIEYIENKGGVRDPEKPFLMMIGMNPPHSPYASTDDKSLTELLVRDNADTTMAKAAAVRYYFANVSGIDREFGRLLAALDRAGLTENTIVVFASDHGETMTSHSTDDPKNSIWRESLNIPFLVRYPGRVPHRVDDLLLSTPDIMPTLLGLAGLGERIPASVEGRDYSAVLRQDAVQPERPRAALYMRNLDGGRDADGLVRGFFAQARGVKTATHTMELRIGRDGTLERVLMFDDAADPYQLHNLAPEEHPALFAALCRELAVLLRDNDDVWFREGVLSDVVPYDTNN